MSQCSFTLSTVTQSMQKALDLSGISSGDSERMASTPPTCRRPFAHGPQRRLVKDLVPRSPSTSFGGSTSCGRHSHRKTKGSEVFDHNLQGADEKLTWAFNNCPEKQLGALDSRPWARALANRRRILCSRRISMAKVDVKGLESKGKASCQALLGALQAAPGRAAHTGAAAQV